MTPNKHALVKKLHKHQSGKRKKKKRTETVNYKLCCQISYETYIVLDVLSNLKAKSGLGDLCKILFPDNKNFER